MSAKDAQAEQSSPDIDSLQADIEEARRDLAETVDALSDKLNVKARTRARLESGRQQAVDGLTSAKSKALDLTDSVREKATDEHGEVRREVLVATGVLVVALTALVALGARRKGR